MILSNIKVQEAMEAGRLIINPKPLPLRPEVGKKCPYDTHTVNLTLGSELSVPQSGPYTFDLEEGGVLSTFLSKNSEKHSIPTAGYALDRSQFILGLTHQYISLPIDHPENRRLGKCLAARVEGRSSIARCGVLVHFTAPTIHPGFEGTITLEIINMGPAKFMLRAGMPIAQLIVEEVDGIPFEKVDRQFQGQRTPEGPSSSSSG